MQLPGEEDVRRVLPGVVGPQARQETGIGAGLSSLGRGLEEVAERRTSFQVAKAQSRFAAKEIAARSELQQDQDWETLPRRYEEAARERLAEQAGLISSNRARALFLEQQERVIQAGIADMRNQAFSIEADQGRASLNEELNSLSSSGLEGDPITAIQTMEDLLGGAVEAGYVTAESAGRLDDAWRKTFAARKIASMPADMRADALSQPWAENIPADVRQEIIRKTQTELIEQTSIDVVDDFIARGLSRSEMRQEIQSIENIELRRAIESRRDYEVAQRDAIRSEEETELFERYADQVRSGRLSLGDIPFEDRRAMDQKSLDALTRLQKSLVEDRKDPETDRMVYMDIRDAMARGDRVGARRMIQQNMDRLSLSDFKTLYNDVSKPDEFETAYNGVRSVDQAISDEMRRAGYAEKTAKAEKAEVRYVYDQMAQDYFRANGRMPDDRWRDETLERLILKTKVRKPGWFNDATTAPYKARPITGVPDEYSVAVRSAFSDAEELPESTMKAYYDQAYERFRAEGIQPSPVDLQNMIEALRKAGQ